MFWPESSHPAAARKSLSVALSSLRDLLEPPGTPPRTLLIADSQAVYIPETAIQTDVHRLLIGIAQAKRTANNTARIAILKQAAEVILGQFVPEIYDDWADVEREWIQAQCRDVLQRLIHNAEVSGSLHEAIAYARRLTQLEPHDEEAREDLSRLLARTRRMGDTSNDAHPDADRERRRSMPTFVAPPTPPRPSGGLPRLEEREIPRPLSLRQTLPAFPTRFFGREQELLRLGWLLRTPSIRLITITGIGGVGKTRLACAAVQEWLHETDEGHGGTATLRDTLFVSLTHCHEAAHLPDMISKTLRMEAETSLPRLPAPEDAEAPFGEIIQWLNQRDHPLLMVLDNFEHLVETGAAFIERLLEQVPNLTCLITSRQRLLLHGEHTIPLEPLPVLRTPLPDLFLVPDMPSATEAKAGCHAFTTAPAVALFLDRAQMASPDFQITEQNTAAIAELVMRLDGIPLAIELAAARAQVLTPRQMLDQMQQRFQFLVNRRRGSVQERHRSLRDTLAWSVSLLPESVQQLFARLAVLRGTWSAETAARLCAAPDPLGSDLLDGITHLCEASLVRATTSTADDTMRFSMIETVRQYAAEAQDALYSDEERTQLLLAHLSTFQDAAREAAAQLHGPEQVIGMTRITMDYENYLAALSYSARLLRDAPLSLGQEAALRGMEIATALHRFWLVRGTLTEGRHHLEQAIHRYARIINLPEDSGGEIPEGRPLSALAEAYNAAGVLALSQHDDAAAEQHHHASRTLFERLGNREGIAKTLNNLAILYTQRQDYARAEQCYRESLTLWQSFGDRGRVGMVLANLGGITACRHCLDEARDYYEASLAVAREDNDVHAIAHRLRNLGRIYCEMEQEDAATQCFRESLPLSQSLQDTVGIAHSLHNLGTMWWTLGNQTWSIEAVVAGRRLFAAVGIPTPAFEDARLHAVAELYTRVTEYEARIQAGDTPPDVGTLLKCLTGLPSPPSAESYRSKGGATGTATDTESDLRYLNA
jgi:predicted ATPase/Flp pilus assembly protein TadD